jgi:SAM-dependent methyltransferase
MYGDPDKYFEIHGDFAAKTGHRRGVIREMIRRTGKRDPSILDIGSGRGELLRAAVLEGVTVAVGLDRSRAMIEYGTAQGLVVIDQTAENYAETAERCFDVVALAAVVEHVEDPDALLRAVARFTGPGFLLLIDVPREPNIVTMAGKVAATVRCSPGVLNLSPTFRPFHVYGFNPKSLRSLLDKHHFALETLDIWAAPEFPSGHGLRDRVLASAGGFFDPRRQRDRSGPQHDRVGPPDSLASANRSEPTDA